MSAVVGWTYEGGIHCPKCAEARFGDVALDDGSAVDREGNTAKPVFSTDEGSDCGDYCEGCGAEVSAPWSQPDATVQNHGSIVILTPVSEEAKDWVQAHLMGPETPMWGKGIVIEPRYLKNILNGMAEAGLEVG